MLADVMNEIDQGEEEDSGKTLISPSFKTTNKKYLTKSIQKEVQKQTEKYEQKIQDL